MALTTAAQILSVQDRCPRRLTVPEWGSDVYVRALSAAEYEQYEHMSTLDVACAGLCTAGGEPLAWTAPERFALSQKHAAAIDRVALEVLRLTGLREDLKDPPQPIRQMSKQEFFQAQKSLKAVADAQSKRRRTRDADIREDGTVRACDTESQQENQRVCA